MNASIPSADAGSLSREVSAFPETSTKYRSCEIIVAEDRSVDVVGIIRMREAVYLLDLIDEILQDEAVRWEVIISLAGCTQMSILACHLILDRCRSWNRQRMGSVALHFDGCCEIC